MQNFSTTSSKDITCTKLIFRLGARLGAQLGWIKTVFLGFSRDPTTTMTATESAIIGVLRTEQDWENFVHLVTNTCDKLCGIWAWSFGTPIESRSNGEVTKESERKMRSGTLLGE